MFTLFFGGLKRPESACPDGQFQPEPGRMVAAGVVVGEGLAYWANAVRLARPLVARQQFLP